MTGRDRTVIVVVAVVAVIAAAWLLVISPKRDQASKLEGQIQSAQSTLDTARSELAQAEAARSAYRGSYTTLVRLGEAVPTDDDVPSLIYQIQFAASRAGVDFRGLTLDPGGAGATTPTAPSAGSTTTPSGSASSSSPTPSSASSSTPAGAAATTPTLPPGVTVGPAGFPVEPFTFTFEGNFFHLANFFGRLQHLVQAGQKRVLVNGRLLSLEAIDLAPGPNGFPQIEASVSATTYLLPPSEGLVEGATPAGPTPVSAAPPASPASPSPSTSTATPPAAVVAPVSGR